MAIRKSDSPIDIAGRTRPQSPEIFPLTLHFPPTSSITPRAHALRRTLLSSALALTVLCLATPNCNARETSPDLKPLAATAAPIGQKYELKLYHLHTGESLDVIYRIGDTYIPAAMDQLNHFLRDHRTEDVSHYDPKEFDLLHSLMARLGKSSSVIDVVCGYRTPWSNNFLRTRSANTGVAKNSEHMQAKAIDIRVPGVSTSRLRNTALSLHAGGVGYYPVSQFVHVDVGPVRQWSFRGRGEN
jgi:uncharacterized protein YcbK (DUF882 family)